MNPPDEGKPPIFVVGFQRSGTTLLQAVLGAHSHIAAAPEMHYWLRIYHQRDYWGDLEDDAALRRAVAAVVDLPLGMLAGAELRIDELYAAVRSRRRDYRALLEVVLDDVAARQGKQRWSEKTPGQTAEQVWELFPEAQVIHIVRDPRQVVASARAMPYNEEAAWRLAEDWRRFTLANTRSGLLRGPRQFLQVRYEDLAAGPVSTARLLCAFLDEPFEPTMVGTPARRAAESLVAAAQPWQLRAFESIELPEVDAWAERLSRRDRWRISAVTAPALAPLGYRPPRRAGILAGRALMGLTRPVSGIANAPRRARARLLRSPESRHRAVDALVRSRVAASRSFGGRDGAPVDSAWPAVVEDLCGPAEHLLRGTQSASAAASRRDTANVPGRSPLGSRGPRDGFTAEEVIDALYRGLLDRPVEPPGLEHHLGLLAGGAELDSVVYGIGHSREYFETWLRAGDLPALLANAWQSRVDRRDERPIFLLHIMKTGGTALADGLRSVAGNRFCLTQVFLDHLVALPPVVVELSSLVSGHLGVEALELMPEGTVSATVIRDPVERVLSHYAHVLVDPALGAEAQGLTLEEFVHSPRWRPFCENFQARSLVHRVDLSSMWRDRSPVDLLAALDPAVQPAAPRLPLQNLFELGPMELAGDDLRRAALESLDAIEVVGVTDRLDDTFSELARIWSVDPAPPVPRVNVSSARPREGDVPARLREVIIEANAVDFALYERARARAAASPTRAASTPARAGDDPLMSMPPAARLALAPADPPPRRRTRLPRRVLLAAGQSRPPRWPLGLALMASAVVAIIDNFFAQGIVLIGLLVLGPCFALLAGRWRATAWIGSVSIVLAAISGLTDGLWGTASYTLFLMTIGIVAVAATLATAVIEQAARSFTRAPPVTPWAAAPTSVDYGTPVSR